MNNSEYRFEENKRRKANQREQDRRRTEALNLAFARLRASLPSVPRDTKLSKLRTLRFAIAYIQHLQAVAQTEGHQHYLYDFPSSYQNHQVD
ncbi:unnamed protein product [Mesocestoides corti]|uniref:BHLH domain-containing protein n=1 Tax=Mesocestoides corti TaxID=53468 RepID=A0A0R3UFN3_MESCO|nr:unnamed protein product [Mesocestoides corti]